MEITKEVKNLIDLVNSKVINQPAPSKLSLPCTKMSIGELAQILNVLAKEYGVSLPVLIRKLDRLSGDVLTLDSNFAAKTDKPEWTAEEDAMLATNTNVSVLLKFKGEAAVERRKKYLQAKDQ